MSRGDKRVAGRGSQVSGHRSDLRPPISDLRVIIALLIALGTIVFASSCQRVGPDFQQMSIQPKYDPLEPSDFFADGMSARPRVAGTVARGEVTQSGFLETGKIGGAEADGFPFPVTAAVINRGQERYDIFCSECHGRLADGNGMIPSRGYRRPPSFHTDALRSARTGHFIDVMTNGFGAMPPYAAQVSVSDRWAIVAYIRALQLSQNATADDVPPEHRADLPGGTR
jgi:mono/diheme cytochrome c family protein